MYTFQSRVRYSEITNQMQLSLPSLVNYFQDCSIFHSDSVGLGLDSLAVMHRAWLLSSWQIQTYQWPKLGDLISVSTWAHSFDHLYGHRNFLLRNEQGQICAAANSLWFLVDTQTGRPTKLTLNDIQNYGLEPPYNMEEVPRKIAIPQSLISYPSFPVMHSALDTNNHVNNSQYIRMAEEYLPENWDTYQIRAEYRTAATLGDMIIPQVALQDFLCTVVLTSSSNAPFAIIEFQAKQPNHQKSEV